MERWFHFLSSELHVPILHNNAKIRGPAARGTKVLDHLYMVLNYNVDQILKEYPFLTTDIHTNIIQYTLIRETNNYKNMPVLSITKNHFSVNM
jgi:hypothetical protein